MEEWVARYNGSANSGDYAYAMAIDSFGNIYVAGSSGNTGNRGSLDFATIKYNSHGVQQWVMRYPDGGARAIALDDSGNVYVTGVNISAYATIKYNSDGVQQWVKLYNANGGASAIAVDGSGNIYVTGSGYVGVSNADDYITIKYNSNGVLQWLTRYNGIGSRWDWANSIAVDTLGNTYVTGSSDGIGGSPDYATIKYNEAGVQQWVARYNGVGGNSDAPNAMTIDKLGNVYVTGGSYGGFGSGQDYATVKYNSAGVQQWWSIYNGPGNSTDKATSIAIVESGDFYVTGESFGNGTSNDYATIKYNTNGVQQWVTRYNGPGNNWDEATSIAIDGLENIYVTGSSFQDYATIKYNSSGVEKWVARYNGTGNGLDYAFFVAVDGVGNVCVTGQSLGDNTGYDFTTIKYSSITKIQNISNEIPHEFYLSQNYPNPFNPNTVINYELRIMSYVEFKVFNTLGNEVVTLINQKQNAGSYSVEFNGENYSSGVYYYKLEAGNPASSSGQVFSKVKKMILLK
jgi:uncharacterized delta-60 repeat protein